MSSKIEDLIHTPSKERIASFCSEKSDDFIVSNHSLMTAKTAGLFPESFKTYFKDLDIVGYFAKGLNLFVFRISLQDERSLQEKSCRRVQFDFAKHVLNQANDDQYDNFTAWLNEKKPYGTIDKALFIFADKAGDFRFSLVENEAKGKETAKRFKRYTFYVNQSQTNRTFRERMALPWGSFEELKEAFSVEKLNKEFYQKLSNWYFWAATKVRFPEKTSKDTLPDPEINSVPLIRLITRLIFVWFMKQKGLIPEALFQKEKVDALLNGCDESSYYKAILQNLFFATLNNQGERRFMEQKERNGVNPQHHVYTVYRYEDFFTAKGKEEFLALMKPIPFLNGGLFACLDDNEKGKQVDGFSNYQPNREKLSVPNELFWTSDETNVVADLSGVYGDKKKNKEHIVGLIPLLSQYNFTIDESTLDDKSVALDPELLGQIFENLLASYNPETKATARKQTGSYYTPREIVNYMVQESLLQHVLTALEAQKISLPEAELRELICHDGEPSEAVKSHKQEIMQALTSCKILDPACGSGAYPMGVLTILCSILQKLEPLENDRDLYQRKLSIIQNCIYGVDIQPIAVQISKLRCFISLLAEDEVNDREPNRGIEYLPNLEMHFVAANTLIDLQGPQDGSFLFAKTEKIKGQLHQTAQKLFHPKTWDEKKSLREQYQTLRQELKTSLKNDFNENDYDKLADWNPFDQMSSSPFFNPEWMFGVKDGFDIVIGNPPYIQLKKNHGQLANIYQDKKFSSFSRMGDIYCLFYEKGIELLKTKGNLCYITSNKWLRANYAFKLRNYFLENGSPIKLVDFGGYKVFNSATVDTNILLYKSVIKNKYCESLLLGIGENWEKIYQEEFFQNQRFRRNEGWAINSEIEDSLIQKIMISGKQLKDFDVSINIGVLTGDTKVFIFNKEVKEKIENEKIKNDKIILPVIRGKNIKKYTVENQDSWLLGMFPSRRININDYPSIKNYLLSFGKERLEQTGLVGARKKTNNAWYETSDTAKYWKLFYSEKIIWPDIAQEMSFALDSGNHCIDHSSFFMVGDEKLLRYLLGILNSKLLNFYYRKTSSSLGDKGMRLLAKPIRALPIPDILKKESKSIIDYVNEILLVKEKNLHADTSQLESEIDQLVYQLYGLTDEEIKVVEDSVRDLEGKNKTDKQPISEVKEKVVRADDDDDDARD